MAGKRHDADRWIPIFLEARHAGLSVNKACARAQIAAGTAYYHRDRNDVLAARWYGGAAPKSAEAPSNEIVPSSRGGNWKARFLETLVETSSISASAARAGAPLSKVYKARRDDAAFAAKWREALLEGYDNLEMELLGYLRDPAPTRKLDVAAALRLLVAHRETIARERALREDEDEQAVLDSIDRFIEDMRQRRLTNAAVLEERAHDDGTGDGED